MGSEEDAIREANKALRDQPEDKIARALSSAKELAKAWVKIGAQVFGVKE